MQQRWADYRVFWQQVRRAYQTTGAVLPSGKALAKALAHFVLAGDPIPADESGRRILEVGPGTGAVTGHIVRDLRKHDQLVLVERNSDFVARLHDRLDYDDVLISAGHKISIVHAGVEELPENEPFDLIISGLPLNNFSVQSVEQILAKFRRLLAPGGTLSFFEYIAMRPFKAAISGRAGKERVRGIARVLNEVLAQHEIRRDAVWANVPPAWVHHVRFGAE